MLNPFFAVCQAVSLAILLLAAKIQDGRRFIGLLIYLLPGMIKNILDKESYVLKLREFDFGLKKFYRNFILKKIIIFNYFFLSSRMRV